VPATLPTPHATETPPVVGVVIPTFNRRELLRAALASALAQTHARLEVLVIDNGSRDGTAELMGGVHDPRVRYVANETNLGMAGSINRAMGLLSGEVAWCTVLSDDDLLDGNFVTAALARGAQAHATSVVSGHRAFVDATGARLRDALPPPAEESAIDYLEARSRGRRETFLSGLLFARPAFDAVGGYPRFTTGLSSDDALLVALGLRDRIVAAPEAVALVRLHPDAESRAAQGGRAKLATVDEFHAYALRTIGAAGVAALERRRFERALDRYCRGLRSHWWQVSMRAAADGAGEGPGEAAPLRELVASDPSSFSRLVRASAWLSRPAGVDLESSKWYRAAMKRLQDLADAIRGLPRVR
jgi:glycosyltransferase involved in cell wall biosynthesis